LECRPIVGAVPAVALPNAAVAVAVVVVVVAAAITVVVVVVVEKRTILHLSVCVFWSPWR